MTPPEEREEFFLKCYLPMMFFLIRNVPRHIGG
jgi:hypothetical protein